MLRMIRSCLELRKPPRMKMAFKEMQALVVVAVAARRARRTGTLTKAMPIVPSVVRAAAPAGIAPDAIQLRLS